MSTFEEDGNLGDKFVVWFSHGNRPEQLFQVVGVHAYLYVQHQPPTKKVGGAA